MNNSGIRQVWTGSYHGVTKFILHNDGTLCSRGSNEGEILGDGTTLDYFDDYLTVDEASFVDFIVRQERYSDEFYCDALDESGNIWTWGNKFGPTPEIEIENTMFTEYGFEQWSY